MAEEDLDFGDDDLDLDDKPAEGDAGEEVAGELDDVMDDDELGGGGGAPAAGGGDSDSELDSFFEDLSSIEDMDEGSGEAEGEPKPAGPEPAAAEPQKKAAPAKEEKKAEPKKKSKLKLIIPVVVLLLILVGGGSYFFLFRNPDLPPQPAETLQETPPTPSEEMPIQVEPKPMPKLEPQPIPRPLETLPAAGPKYLVQVATCTYDSCKEEYIQSLREDGEPVYQKASGEKYDFIELISRQVFSEEKANLLVREINRKNKMAGNAFVMDQSNGYRISMGTFPALDRAKEVKFHIEQLFPDKSVVFDMEHVRKSYTTTKIYAGPYESRAEAKSVLAELRKKQKYKGAFIVQTTEPI